MTGSVLGLLTLLSTGIADSGKLSAAYEITLAALR
jgi:hypothetical protein